MVVGVLLVPSGAVASARSRPTASSCMPRTARALLADAEAAVYSIRAKVTGTQEGERYTESLIETRACGIGRAGSVLLFSRPVIQPTEEHFAIEHLVLHGAMLAYATAYYGGTRYTEEQESPEEWRVIVRDLRTGQIIHNVTTGPKDPAHPKLIGDGWTVAIVLRADGSVAWTTQAPYFSGSPYAVHVLDGKGDRELAVGTTVDPHSLALSDGTLYWTQDGTPMSAPIY